MDTFRWSGTGRVQMKWEGMMRRRNTGTLALTAGLCLLAMACGDSDSTQDEDGDGVAVPVGEAAEGLLLASPPPPEPGTTDPSGSGPPGYYGLWGPGGPYSGAWNYGAAGYGAPGYGAPGYGTPGYGTPGYGTPGYGTPGYGTPGYGALGGYGGLWGYGLGGHGAPAYGTPGVYGSPWGYGGGYGAGYGRGYGTGHGAGYGTGHGAGYGGGWGGAYGPQATRQVQASMGAGLEPGVSDIPWVSPWRGGGVDGTEYVVSCDPGMIAVGFYGRADSFVDQLGLVCAEVLPGGVLGAQDLYGVAGGEGGKYFIDKCPDGYGVAGFSGRADLVVNQLRLVCDRVAPVPLLYGPMFGGVGGTEWTDVSPGAFFLTEIRGRSGAQVEGLQSVHRFVKG